jgi:hypothetical protein
LGIFGKKWQACQVWGCYTEAMHEVEQGRPITIFSIDYKSNGGKYEHQKISSFRDNSCAGFNYNGRLRLSHTGRHSSTLPDHPALILLNHRTSILPDHSTAVMPDWNGSADPQTG